MIKRMELGYMNLQMVIGTKGSGERIKKRVKASNFLIMEIDTKVNLKMAKKKEGGYIITRELDSLMEIDMRVSGVMVKSKEGVYITTVMEISSLEHGRMERRKVREYTIQKKETMSRDSLELVNLMVNQFYITKMEE